MRGLNNSCLRSPGARSLSRRRFARKPTSFGNNSPGRVLSDPGGLWEESALSQWKRLQAFLFPTGLRYDGGSFGTAVKPLSSRLWGSLASGGSEVVTPWGFEPQSPG